MLCCSRQRRGVPVAVKAHEASKHTLRRACQITIRALQTRMMVCHKCLRVLSLTGYTPAADARVGSWYDEGIRQRRFFTPTTIGFPEQMQLVQGT